MSKFRIYNLATGWILFLVAAVVYLLTIEPTSSFWDCGEFIATAYKLEVGHPPGAPFFMILGRFFTLFAGGNEMAVAKSMNVLSALSSAFTILFLFWTITHLVRKFYNHTAGCTTSQMITIMGAGAVGALAYTFSDTFWFSAVEAEVYATSSLFTAFVFWAMLKWENIADEPHANRWIILIALLAGISIGIHLLNLLTIPALVFIYFFRKYTFSWSGFAAAVGVSIALLAIVLYVVIPGIPYFGSRFELLFVNAFNLPYFTGVAFYILLFVGLIIFGIYYTYRKGQVLWNTIILALFVIFIGYSSYAVILIRSVANTPLDESNPETMFLLQSYLNREQYGDRPLAYGAYFNARPTAMSAGKKTYVRTDEGYREIQKDRKYEYDSNFEGFFPRMWSSQSNHTDEYIYWGKLDESRLYNIRTDKNGQPITGQLGQVQFDRSKPKDRPTFGENLRFFFRYQVGYMYMRYFMWNFAGRQNDLQGHGELTKGNWISGIRFIDEARLGPQDNLPGSIVNNWAHNRYYMLPLLLGLVGMFFHFRRHLKDAWVVSLLFILTGLAVVVYLNQYPLQPRERDYAYAGSFYAFAIWIGLGVVGLIEAIGKKLKHPVVPALVVAVTLLAVPVLMAAENWDDHDRSDRYTARDFARNYLNSCDEDAIIYTNGDNDTFPLWYVQEVEGFRTDVRVVNLSYLTADWYIEQMTYAFYDSDPLPINLTKEQYLAGSRDYAYLVESAMALIREKYTANEEKYRGEAMRLFNEAKTIIDRSKLPTGFSSDYKTFLALEENMDVLRLFSYLRSFNSNEVAEKIAIDQAAMSEVIEQVQQFISTVDADFVPLKDAMQFLASDDPRFRDGQYFIPARKFIVPVDSSRLPESLLTPTVKKHLQDEIRFRMDDNVLYKNRIIQLDILAHNDWRRPIYFSNTVSSDNFMNLEKAFIEEGLAYRIAPVNVEQFSTPGLVDTDRMYQRLMEEFLWGGIDDPDVYLDENNIRMTIKYRYTYATLSRALSEQGDTEKAVDVLDYCMEHMPHERVPFNFSIIPIIQSYFAAGATEQGLAIVEQFEGITEEQLKYYLRAVEAKPGKAEKMNTEIVQSLRDLNTMRSICLGYGETDVARRLEEKVQAYAEPYERIFR
jgi:hypothetical protein